MKIQSVININKVVNISYCNALLLLVVAVCLKLDF